MQSSNTSQMIFSCASIVSYLSRWATLLPGTVIMTGTPEGVGFKRESEGLSEGGAEGGVQHRGHRHAGEPGRIAVKRYVMASTAAPWISPDRSRARASFGFVERE